MRISYRRFKRSAIIDGVENANVVDTVCSDLYLDPGQRFNFIRQSISVFDVEHKRALILGCQGYPDKTTKQHVSTEAADKLGKHILFLYGV